MTPKQRRRYNKRVRQGKVVAPVVRTPWIVRFMRALQGAKMGW